MFVHGRDPVWVYREEDYKRMINMDNNPEPTSSRRSRMSRRPGRTAMTRLGSGSVPSVMSGSCVVTRPIWRRRLVCASSWLRCGCEFRSCSWWRRSWSGAGRDPQSLGPADAGHAFSKESHRNAVSTDTEYFCPMDPGVVSDWPGRCGICNMALVRRKRGEALVLPDGASRECSFRPTGFSLPGIQTAPGGFSIARS